MSIRNEPFPARVVSPHGETDVKRETSDLFTRLKALMDEQEPPEGAFTAAQFADRTAMNTINARDRLDRLVTTGVLQCGMFRARTVNGSVRQQKLYWEKKSG